MGIESEKARETATFSDDSNVTELDRPAIICKTNELPKPPNVAASGVNPTRSTNFQVLLVDTFESRRIRTRNFESISSNKNAVEPGGRTIYALVSRY